MKSSNRSYKSIIRSASILVVFSNLLFSTKVLSQSIIVQGIVKDKHTGELLENVALNTRSLRVFTNAYGFYSINLDKADTLVVDFLGYQKLLLPVNYSQRLNLSLEPKIINLKEIQINYRKNIVDKNNISVFSLNANDIKQLPSMAGEPDVLKSIQTLPGIQVSNEGTNNLSVRGGTHDQNLILLDESTVYNLSHSIGFLSVFNTEAVKNVSFYKSYIPARYGGRTSSVLDIKMKEGNEKQTNVHGSIGLLASGLMIEGPILPDSLSYMISGRYSYAGQVVNGLGHVLQQFNITGLQNFSTKNRINFYDINAKINYKLNEKNRFYFSIYNGNDKFYYYLFDNDNGMLNWGNTNGTFRWNQVITPRLFANYSIIWSKYHYNYDLDQNSNRNFRWKSSINNFSIKGDFQQTLTGNVTLKSGFQSELLNIQPGSVFPLYVNSVIKNFKLNNQKGVQNAIYVESNIDLTSKLKLDLGLRASNVFNLTKGWSYIYSSNHNIIDSTFYNSNQINSTYWTLEPRTQLSYSLTSEKTIYGSYIRTTQYEHLLSNSQVGWPTDIWMLSNKNIHPQRTDQISLGANFSENENNYTSNIEVYFKKSNNILDYVDNADLFLNNNVENQIIQGHGRSYGVEYFLNKTKGKFTGWFSYTLSKSERKIPGINEGKYYPQLHDKRHNLTISANRKLSKKWSLNALFTFNSGGMANLPQGNFFYEGVVFNDYGQRNSFKLPNYHRLDLSLQFEPAKNLNRKWQSKWVFEIYNVYAKRNLFSLYMKQDPYNLTDIKAYKVYLNTIVPTVNYKFSF
ncbi:TonB-dependent receptor [Solitalea lacus]|uniref:TonB-dependent receptor n=1 Tax=Solitalea lacus TaxID=2911172 RepID=UPI001EDAA21F|nr:TonB-dependent receptor [Solitalea lacus]UKJ07333.1 TonB-dependent receptor [Solitalea lacus]